MATQFLTSLVKGDDSFEVGKESALQAKKQMNGANSPDLVVMFSSSKYDHPAVVRGVKSVMGEVPIVGCTSAGQFSDKESTKDGLACAFISSNTHRFFTGMGTNIRSNPIQSIENAVQNFPRDVEGYPYQSAMLFVDGLAGKGEEVVLAASSVLGPMIKFAGGAAADNLHFRETSIFCNENDLSDAVSLCLVTSRSPVIISVKHGHRPITPPLRVTKAEGNILYEVEGRPALEVWKDYIREPLKKNSIDIDKLNPEELSKILLKYEAGLMTGTDYKIRFPASCNSDGSLNFVSSILEGSVIKIMDSDEKDQIESTRKAAELAISHSRGIKLAGAIVFDCACRAMILKDKFPEAVKATKEVFGSMPFIGCETYGEIAMEMGQMSGFHNTTTVIMLFPA